MMLQQQLLSERRQLGANRALLLQPAPAPAPVVVVPAAAPVPAVAPPGYAPAPVPALLRPRVPALEPEPEPMAPAPAPAPQVNFAAIVDMQRKIEHRKADRAFIATMVPAEQLVDQDNVIERMEQELARLQRGQ